MKWIRSQEQSLPDISRSVLTIGNYDGVHLGHRHLLSELVKTARHKGVPSVVCTFRPHPLEVIKPEQMIHRLFDYRDQSEVISQLGVDYLIEEKFTKELSLMSAQDFLDFYVMKYFKPVHIVVGYDFSFGKNRTGDFNFLIFSFNSRSTFHQHGNFIVQYFHESTLNGEVGNIFHAFIFQHFYITRF